MRAYNIVVETLDDKTKQYCLFDEKEGRVIARYGKKSEAEEVLVRYLSAVDRVAT